MQKSCLDAWRMLTRLTGAGVLMLLVVMGCATEKHPESHNVVNDYYLGNYPAARQILRPLAEKTDEDYVLNNVRLGSVEMSDYDLKGAEAAFYKAYEVINSVKVN